MNIHELNARYPWLYREVFNRGVKAEREKILAADLIANASPQRTSPAVFALRSIQNALVSKRERLVRSLQELAA
jgi:hypothetical protein